MVAGASGSGKSTLLRAASGLVPHFHGGSLAGRVTVAGMDTREHGPGELAGAVGTLFQDPETQVVMGTVRAELAFPLENRGESAGAIARGVEEAALALGIGELLERATGELSGGELQRVALGAALAGRPLLVVLDEPTSQLDPVAGDELIGLLRRLNEDFEVTVLLAEHRLERCLAFADRVVAMAGGRVDVRRDARGIPGVGGVRRAGARDTRRPAAPRRRPARCRGGQSRPLGLALARSATGRGCSGARSSASQRDDDPPALAFRGVWHELRGGASILRGASLAIGPRRTGRADGRKRRRQVDAAAPRRRADAPTRGRVTSTGRVALLLQNPTDYLVHETVAAEAPASALSAVGLDPQALAQRHPRDLSGGEKQRLALAIVLGDGSDPPAVLCLDEPTRGMDRGAKEELARLLQTLDAAVLVATHDPEFVAAFAERVVLLADGAPIADGPGRRGALRRDVLRDRNRADPRRGRPGALTPRSRDRADQPGAGGGRVSWQLGAFTILGARARRRVRLVRAQPSGRADRGARGDARRVRGARANRVRGAAERQADDRHRADLRLRARRRAGVRRRRADRADVELLLRAGTVDAVADGRVGARPARSAPGLRS